MIQPAVSSSRKRFIIAIACAGVFLLLGLMISMTNGSAEIAPLRVLNMILQDDGSLPRKILMNIRLPRTILAVLVGINLALAGVILQAIMRNPLADPGIIGVSAGSGLFGVLILIVFPNLSYALPPFAFIGAMIACGMVYVLSWKKGLRPVRLILAGVAVSAFFGAGISALMLFYSDRVQGALLFMSGSLSATTWKHVLTILPYTTIGVLLIAFQTEKLNLLLLGEEAATGLGVNVNKARLWLTVIASLLAASAVSVVGLLGFVGLVVPHISRMIVGNNHRFLVPSAAILGSTVLLLSDTFARNVVRPVEIPVGIIMALFGAPFFLFLLRKSV